MQVAEAAKGAVEALGSKGKAVCLISGGIDSPAAAWLMMRVGVKPIFVYFDSHPLVSSVAVDIALDAMRKLAERYPGESFRAYVVPHAQDLEEIASKCPIRLACIISRRLMLRIARAIAKLEGADAIVLGDAVGQKASQTLQNLAVTDEAVGDTPILRPLAGMNKVEIERMARAIGTYQISIRPGVASCGIPAERPRTRAPLEEVSEAEAKLDVNAMVSRALSGAKVLDLMID